MATEPRPDRAARQVDKQPVRKAGAREALVRAELLRVGVTSALHNQRQLVESQVKGEYSAKENPFLETCYPRLVTRRGLLHLLAVMLLQSKKNVMFDFWILLVHLEEKKLYFRVKNPANRRPLELLDVGLTVLDLKGVLGGRCHPLVSVVISIFLSKEEASSAVKNLFIHFRSFCKLVCVVCLDKLSNFSKIANLP